MAQEEEETLVLPPGFRFHPTDEEIITHYLSPKVLNYGFCARAMGEVDLNKCEPWDLPSKAKMKGEKEWYFFCQKDRKYPTGMRTNRATESGYWKATGKDKEIYRGRGVIIGMKKTLVFYKGRAPKGEKMNWVMHEYRLEGKVPLSNLSKSAKDEWVVSRVFDKNAGPKKSPMQTGAIVRVNPFAEDLQNSPNLPPLMDSTAFINSNNAIEDINAWLYSNKNQYSINDPSASSSYLHQDQNPYFSVFEDMGNYSEQVMINRHCKVEQFSNQSHDTGLSTDRNTEISSAVTKHVASYDEEFDLHSMWRF